MVHPVNNTKIVKCNMCSNNICDGIMRDSFFFCNTTCYQNKMFFDNMSQPQPQPQPKIQQTIQNTQITQYNQNTQNTQNTQNNTRHYGTCATCRNKYDYKVGCVDMGDKWFCSNTCSRMNVSGGNVQAVAFPFVSNMYTVFPLRVDARAGKLFF